MSAMDLPAEWKKWIGDQDELTDEATLAYLDRMSATFDRDDAPWQAGDPVPPMWHFMYFPMVAKHSGLGPDGHPARGGFLPPVPLPRRMFAGARTIYHRPIRAGDRLRREGEVVSIDRKMGKSGELVFLLVKARLFTGDDLAIEEEQDVVYRDLTAPAQTATRSEPTIEDPNWRREITPDPVLLYRYSALTFNGHRIHYDRPYTTGEEGYPGLLVHGPLIATFLSELCRDNTGDRPIARFAFRAKRPIFDTAPFTVTGALTEDGAGAQLEALDPDGAVGMSATVAFAD